MDYKENYQMADRAGYGELKKAFKLNSLTNQQDTNMMQSNRISDVVPRANLNSPANPATDARWREEP